jgi:ketosteroid isomerase-like protein
MRFRQLFAVLPFFIVFPTVSASQGANNSTARPSIVEQASVALPAELERVLRDYERAWRAGDIPAIVSLFSTDGFVLQPGRAPARGREALAAIYTGQVGGDLRLRAIAFAMADTVGYIIGGYRYGDATSEVGKFTLTLRRTRGDPWLIFSDMDNSSAPPRQRHSSRWY